MRFSPTSGMTSATVPSAASSPYISNSSAGVAALERGTELERHARAAQVLERAFVVGALGVDNGDGIWQRVARQVVIRDDEVKAQLLCAGGLLDGGNAVVYRHDKLEALGRQRFQRRACQTVAGAAG